MARLVLFLLSLSLSSTADAAEVPKGSASQKEFSLAITSAKNWNELLRSVTIRLPKNVAEEFAKLANQLEFPEIQYSRSIVSLKNPNGVLAKVRFVENGRVLINGSEWLPDPAASISDELERAVEFISASQRHSFSLLNFFVPSAVAVPSNGGPALAAVAAGYGWTADACRQKNLSTELRQTCPLMAVAMRASLPADPTEMVPVYLNCPSGRDNGILTRIVENRNGESQKIDVAFRNGTAVRVDVLTAGRNKPYDTNHRFVVDLEREQNRGKLILAKEDYAIPAKSVNDSICNNTAEVIRRHKESLKANKDELRRVAPENFNPGVPGRNIPAV